MTPSTSMLAMPALVLATALVACSPEREFCDCCGVRVSVLPEENCYTGACDWYCARAEPVDGGPDADTNADAGEDAGAPTDAGGSSDCPATPPSDGTACDGEPMCGYLRCEAEGSVVATCESGAWSVVTEPCESRPCGKMGAGPRCDPGFVCVEYQSGAHWWECIPQPCGEGPLTCSCVCGMDTCRANGPFSFTCIDGCDGCP